MTDKPAAAGKAYTEQPSDWPGVVASFRDAPQYVHTGVFILLAVAMTVLAFKAKDIGAGIGLALGRGKPEKEGPGSEVLNAKLESLDKRLEQLQDDFSWLRGELSELQDRYATKDEFKALTRLTEHLIEEVTRTVAVIRERALSE